MRTALLALLLAGCHANTNAVAGALVMTPLALGASAISRSSGGCYAVCQQGEHCNEKNGLCEALPCRGQCPASQSCEETFFGIKCIDGTPLSVQGKAVPASAKVPAAGKAPDAKAPDAKAPDGKPAAPPDAVAPRQ